MSDQQQQQNPLDTVSTAIVERRSFDQGQLRQSFTSTTVQYLLRWSQVSLTQRTTATLIDPTGGRRGICTPVVPNGPQHIACSRSRMGQGDQSTIRRTTLANLPIPVLLLTDQAYSIELAKAVTSVNVSLSSPSDVANSPNRVLFTLNPRAEVGMSTASTWSIVGITVGVALGAIVLTSLLMHVQLWRMRRARARKAFVRAVHDVEDRVLAHHQGENDDNDHEHVEDHLLSKAMLDDLPIKPYSTSATRAKAARDRRVQSWLVPQDQEGHLLPLSPRMRTSIVSRGSSIYLRGRCRRNESKDKIKENMSPNARARSPLATDRVPRDPPTAKRARPVSFHPDTRGGNDNDESDAFVVPPMSPGVPSPPASPTVGTRPALKPFAQPAQKRGSWASLDANPRAKLAENMGEGSKRTSRPLSMLNPASAAAAMPRKSTDTTRRQSRPCSPYLHADTDPMTLSGPGSVVTSASASVNDSCPICVDVLVEGDQVRELPCAHVFHVACVDTWLTEEIGQCPLCKFDVRGWWDREMADGDDEEEETESSSEEEEQQQAKAKQGKGRWFARAFGRKAKEQLDEERGLEPMPSVKSHKAEELAPAEPVAATLDAYPAEEAHVAVAGAAEAQASDK
ncbi:hypothetical protein BCR44DRAFT_1425305 [Catenaria anguillulae PL171]|uniref:RING-type E3 ubiquitin transferase n=1 Tax=Catenaria anguillulae PL171 TaxID=765915 RepID=A0A1Y2I121_9FUNG|nr:hypothetical protein BCR44DRAFT_1425305 [Catenaria anguillulae PL171]